jgi:EAL domain-containing protein (putative c-di-GMP-specific phosphodiesterase class I)
MAAWNKSGAAPGGLVIGVNTQFEYLNDRFLIPDLEAILAETSLQPEYLHLEVPEKSIMAHWESASATLHQLKQMRVGLEIDDFGTSQESPSYLRKLPFDTLKIDRSFVKELGTANDSSEIISTILTFVGDLGMNVAAEGVETKDQFERLTALGCCRGQGHYFSEPVDAAGAHALLQKRDTLH